MLDSGRAAPDTSGLPAMDQSAQSAPATAPPDLPARPLAVRRGSRRTLLLLVAVTLVPALILGAASRSAWHATWTEADRELAIGAEAGSEFALRIVESQGRLVVRIGELVAGLDDQAVRAGEPALRDRVRRLIADMPLARAVLITDATGQTVLQVNRAGGDLPPLRPPREGLTPAAPGLLISPALSAGLGTTPVVVMAQDRSGAAGRVAAVIDAGALGAGLARGLGHEEDSAALIRMDGQILARQPPFVVPPPPLGLARPIVAALAAGRTMGRLDGRTPRDDRRVLVRFRTLDGYPSLAVAVARPRAEVIRRWWATVTPLFLIGVPALVALGALGAVVLRQQRMLEAALAGLEERVAERTASLREGEERLRMAIEAGRFGTWETDLRTGVTTRSARSVAILGLDPSQAASHFGDWSARIHPADRTRVTEAFRRLAAGSQPGYREEYRYAGIDGRWRWLESSGAALRIDPLTGLPQRIAGMVRDITARREDQERRDLLTQEVNHRARNLLAIVQAILRLTRAEDIATYARVVEGRIAALARAQSLLAAEHWTGAPLPSVLTEELAPFGSTDAAGGERRGRFALRGPPLRLRAEAVQPLGIVLHELATNAAKHGALLTPEGRIDVAWVVDETSGMLTIHWTETGGPPPGAPTRRGIGSRVMEATISGQLGGRIERRWPGSGLICTIVAPLARMRAGPS